MLEVIKYVVLIIAKVIIKGNVNYVKKPPFNSYSLEI